MAADGRRRATLHGTAWMALGMSCIGLADAAAKYLAESLHGLAVTWGYLAFMLLSLLTWLALRGELGPPLLRTERRGLQLMRGACLAASLSFLYGGIRYLPLAEATTISFTAPLFIALLAGPLLGERVTVRRWLAIGAGAVGALLVIRPGTAIFQWVSLLPMIGAVFFALYNVITRRIGGRERTTTMLLYTFLTGTVLLGTVQPLVWTPPSAAGWVILAGAGALGFVAHIAIVQSLKLADASAMAPLNYVRLVWAVLLGYLLFGQLPDTLDVIGAAIIVGAGLLVIMPESD